MRRRRTNHTTLTSSDPKRHAAPSFRLRLSTFSETLTATTKNKPTVRVRRRRSATSPVLSRQCIYPNFRG
ncbi:hypothetical protein OROMI_019672 [Orobanche minor]